MSLIGAFTGANARDDLEQYGVQSTAALNQGLTDYTNTIDPTIQSGDAARDLESVFLGLSGDTDQERLGNQQAYFDNFQYDPGLLANIQQGIKGISGTTAARGLRHSGRALKELANYSNDRIRHDAFGERKNRLSGLARVGDQARSDLGNAQFGTGQLQANQLTALGNASAATQSTGVNNLLSLINAGATAYAGAA